MRYLLRYEDDGQYVCDPLITTAGVTLTGSESREDAFIFADLGSAYDIVRCVPNLYVVPLVRRKTKR